MTEPTTGPRTALDDLDAALARMQGDDSGGPLAPALDAARRARAEQQRTVKTELRIRREVRALIFPLLALMWALAGAVARAHGGSAWADLLYAAFSALALLAWAQNRPPLPGDSTPADWVAFVRAHPLVWSINVVLAVGTGVAIAQAIGEHTALWFTAAAVMLGLCAFWFAFIVSRSRRRPDPQQPTGVS